MGQYDRWERRIRGRWWLSCWRVWPRAHQGKHYKRALHKARRRELRELLAGSAHPRTSISWERECDMKGW